MEKWDFPSFKFGTPPAKVDQKEQVAPAQQQKPQAAVSVLPKMSESVDLKTIRMDINRLERLVNEKSGTSLYNQNDDQSFRKEMINFLRYLMDSIEKVTGGRFPTKEKICDELRSRYLKDHGKSDK